MNAEAKKKVDVLSDELLPYIIAEQERRTTLYKRIMTAIQNGEKGVTIAEIRNKPPLIIRKGLFYRCPSNRAPKEPDGSGTLMCEEDIEPTQIMYDSCLSAEDKDLYVVADSKYFFCNRHNVEGPDLPRNGSTVIGCPPMERTSLNYTTTKCALEDTDDVVVHYRYYPDRSYKFVMELDPDHEVCDHWNPCQIGYIYSLPSPDQAVLANELWRDEDAIEEFVHSNSVNYTSSPRRVPIPSGYKFQKLWAKRTIDGFGWNPQANKWHATADIKQDAKFVTVRLNFPENWSDFFYSTYYAVFVRDDHTRRSKKSPQKSVKFLTITMSNAQVVPNLIQMAHGNITNNTQIPYKCTRCHLQGIMVRTPDGYVHNVDPAKYRIKDVDRKQTLEIDLEDIKPSEVGDFFAMIQNADGLEERVKVLTIQAPGKNN
ncbi:uncharacterized protein LOC126379676 [Pectinophora gossypiella]|uniref:uncharacterized protein LOC126379676 n=1 Tax=Pectinophora gossypiella TaxID=13191 RepID=UPI00214F233E|nr:uncharacterized protein LOC126379676 [Pectinophora gossypiella]